MRSPAPASSGGGAGWGGAEPKDRTFVELPVLHALAGDMRIILPNRIEMAVGPGWTAEQVAAMVRDSMGCNPLDGSLYRFAGMGGHRLKVLYWDHNGYCLWQKRLEAGRFPWPREAGEARSITGDQLTVLLDGIDFWRAHQRREYKNL